VLSCTDGRKEKEVPLNEDRKGLSGVEEMKAGVASDMEGWEVLDEDCTKFDVLDGVREGGGGVALVMEG
jgi:hypothetical protein